MKFLPLLLASAFSLLLSSCETTGDPAAGGFFGWSEEKSNQRIYAREEALYNIEADTARTNYETRGVRSQVPRGY